MCRPGGRHFTGSSKRVEAFSKSSNLVVNSVSLSRDLLVFPGFFEIIRVVGLNIILHKVIELKLRLAEAGILTQQTPKLNGSIFMGFPPVLLIKVIQQVTPEDVLR